MYIRDKYVFPKSIEYEYKFKGNYGAKGEKRRPKVKPTEEQIQKQNQKHKEKQCRRLIKLNFDRGDIWATFLYPKGTRKPIAEIKDDFKRFIRKLRTRYKARGQDLKFVYRIEIGSKGGIHIHMIANRIDGEDLMMQELWQQGRVSFERFGGEEEDYEKLANYIVKAPNEEQLKQIKAIHDKDEKALISYSSSRNLIRPEPERKEYSRRTVRKLITDGPCATKGYYIDKSSIYHGINPYTGMSYFYYREIKIDPGG